MGSGRGRCSISLTLVTQNSKERYCGEYDSFHCQSVTWEASHRGTDWYLDQDVAWFLFCPLMCKEQSPLRPAPFPGSVIPDYLRMKEIR